MAQLQQHFLLYKDDILKAVHMFSKSFLQAI